MSWLWLIEIQRDWPCVRFLSAHQCSWGLATEASIPFIFEMCPEKYGLESVQVPFERAPFPQKNRPSSLPATVLFFICSLLGISQQPQTPSIPILQMLKLKSREVRQLAMVTLWGAEEPRLNAGFSIPKSHAHCMPSHAPATTSVCVSADVLLVYKVVRCICDLGL